MRTTAGVAMLGFVVTFAAIRGLTYSIHVGIGPFHDVSTGGTHIHHMVWGILLLLAAGYIRLLHDGSGMQKSSLWNGWLMAALYGAGAALTLDEFALWLHMRDVYWQVQGWESVGAVLIFAGVLLTAVVGRSFVKAAARMVIGHRTRARLPGRVAVEGE
jgi:hypothetical protein